MDQVSEAVLILQNGLTANEGPVIAWGNQAAVRCTGIAAADLFGSPLQPLLTEPSWQLLLKALHECFAGESAACTLTFHAPDSQPMSAQVKATRGPSGEILGVILTLSRPVASAVEAAPAAPGLPTVPDLSNLPAPSPQGWQEDVIETIRETARQVAHEFNNALTSIVLPVQLAIRAIPQNGDLFDSLEVAHVSAQRASDLAKDFLDCFRPRSAVRSRCAPAALLGRSIRLATCAQNVSSSLELPDQLPEIEVDESQLERVIFNLIRNSVQAMPSGGRLRVSAARRDLTAADNIALPDGPYIQISVRDWGPGIPDEHLQHLFHGRFTTKPEGNGCGLPICYQIVREHGGEMLVRSRVNVGTEFLIYLPALDALPAAALLESAPPAKPTAAPASTRPEVEAAQPIPASIPLSPPPAVPSPFTVQKSAPIPALAPLVPLTPLVPPLPAAAAVPALPVPSWPVAAALATAPITQAVPAVAPSPSPFSWLPDPGSSPIPTAPVPAPPTPTPPRAGHRSSDPDPINYSPPVPSEDAPPSLLVVDDEQGVRTALSQIAKIMGFDVSTVGTSDEALQTYKDRLHASRPFSTVLLDLNLRSGLNGMEVFQAIRRMDPEALVVATSGQHAEGDVERFRALGFAGFLPKPYSLEHFDSVMRAALAS